VTALSNGNYVVVSPFWNNKAGAATWGNGSTGIIGLVSAVNSLVGSTGDQVGDAVTALSNGNYFVTSPLWNGGRGAATWGNGSDGTTLDGQHTIDEKNSILGSLANGGKVLLTPGSLSGSCLVAFPQQNGGRVSLGFTAPNQIAASLAQDQTISVTAALLAAGLDAGTAVVLQASNSLTVASPVHVSARGHGGALTLEAPTVLLNADISTDGGKLTFGGNVSPGAGMPAVVHLSASTVAFQPQSSYSVQLDGTLPGTDFEQLEVSGVFTPGNATLHVSSKGHFARGQTFVLVHGSTPITTTFAGLHEGSLVSAGGQMLKISYKHDEITLTVQ
jgi:hypothetical protein